jgi:hypothetical protein
MQIHMYSPFVIISSSYTISAVSETSLRNKRNTHSIRIIKQGDVTSFVSGLKQRLRDLRYKNDGEVQTAVKQWLSDKHMDFCRQGIRKTVPRHRAPIFVETFSKINTRTIELPRIFHMRDCNKKNNSNCMPCKHFWLTLTDMWSNLIRFSDTAEIILFGEIEFLKPSKFLHNCSSYDRINQTSEPIIN